MRIRQKPVTDFPRDIDRGTRQRRAYIQGLFDFPTGIAVRTYSDL